MPARMKGLSVAHFSILSNHIHFILEPSEASLARTMQSLCGARVRFEPTLWPEAAIENWYDEILSPVRTWLLLSDEGGKLSSPDPDRLFFEILDAVRRDDLCSLYRTVKHGLSEIRTRELMQLILNNPDAMPIPASDGSAALAIASLDSCSERRREAVRKERQIYVSHGSKDCQKVGPTFWVDPTFFTASRTSPQKAPSACDALPRAWPKPP